MTTQLTTTTDPLMPIGPNALDQVIWQATDNMGEYYTITFTNNTNHTVYPFLQTTNDAEKCSSKNGDHYACSNYDPNDPTKSPGSIYDPIDPWNEDYRGYIGYTGTDGINYLGIPAGKTVTITVPLVFWDACRIYVASDSTYFISPPGTQVAQATPPINPYNFFWLNQDGTPILRCQQTMQDFQETASDLQVVVLWYHCQQASTPANDAPAQLLEFTLRHTWQQTLNTYLDENTLGPLINYDVSYVDTIYLPAAMEADDFTDGQSTYGWIGASQTEAGFQQAFANFTSFDPTQSGLGQYFGGKGYTQYYFPADVKAAFGIKLPSGAQALGDSPFTGHPSSFNNYTNILESADTDRPDDFRVDVNASKISGQPDSTKTINITLNGNDVHPSGAEQLQTIQDALNQGAIVVVTCTDPNCPGFAQTGTRLMNYVVNSDNPQTGTAYFDKPVTFPATINSCSISLTPVITDYVATPILNLWYSWAQYYITNNLAKGQSLWSQNGSITVPDKSHSNVLVFSSPVPVSEILLVPGMQVTGSGIDDALCTVLDVVKTSDSQFYQSVSLSIFVTTTVSGCYTFVTPQPIAGVDATSPLTGDRLINPFSLTFSGDDATTALSFSQSVYQIMSAMSTIPLDTSQTPQPLQILYNVIGCNVGQIPFIGQDSSSTQKDSLISGEITNKVKSVLRGVPDFKTDPESFWYPDPSVPKGGCNFNVFNLDPFVWFVHKKLGLSGYGFSVDDDIADVGANKARNLKIAIGGLNGLPNWNPWIPQ